jgi:hypothetical protein
MGLAALNGSLIQNNQPTVIQEITNVQQHVTPAWMLFFSRRAYVMLKDAATGERKEKIKRILSFFFSNAICG